MVRNPDADEQTGQHLVAEPHLKDRGVSEAIAALLPQLEYWFDAFVHRGSAHIAEAVRARVEWGRRASLEVSPGRTLDVRAVDIDVEGALIVEDGDGGRHTIRAGNVSWGSRSR